MLLLVCGALVGREPENAVDVVIEPGRVPQCQKVVVVQARLLFELEGDLAARMVGLLEAY